MLDSYKIIQSSNISGKHKISMMLKDVDEKFKFIY